MADPALATDAPMAAAAPAADPWAVAPGMAVAPAWPVFHSTWVRRVEELTPDGFLRIGVEMSHTHERSIEVQPDMVENVSWRYEYGINGAHTVRLIARIEMENGDVLAIGGETLPNFPFTREVTGPVVGLGKGHGKGH